MAKTTLSNTITFNGKEAREAILEPAFNKKDFTRIHTVYPNIVAKEQIAFMERFNKISVKDTGCGTGNISKSLSLQEKFWDPVKVKAWLQFCYSDFEAQFFIWGMKKGIDRADLTDTDLAMYLMEILPDSMLEDLWRMVWFSDTDIGDISDSPAGVLSNDSDVKFYNLIDGLWKQIFAGVAISEGTWGHIPRYTITQNSAGSYAAQLALSDGQSLTIFRKLLQNADTRLRSARNKVILCTDTIFQNWIDYKESKVLESSWGRQNEEFEQGLYRGATIIPIELWDRYIQADFDDGSTYYLPNRAVLTTVENLAVGFDSYQSSQGNFKAFLDEVTELYHVKGGYRLDAKILNNFMFSVAY